MGMVHAKIVKAGPLPAIAVEPAELLYAPLNADRDAAPGVASADS